MELLPIMELEVFTGVDQEVDLLPDLIKQM
jgi:hypothetical protein